MNASDPIVEATRLHYAYDRREAVAGLNLSVRPGRCHALLGRNGAGKTTTLKCLLNLLRPDAGTVRLFGLDPARHPVEVKSRLAYVPDAPAFYPWMDVAETLDYLASFRPRWNRRKQAELLERFSLDARLRVTALSRGQKTQLALTGALCAEPELLILDEPTSGLDPVVRRSFIETVIAAYQDAPEEPRTLLVSTHLISEFEGLIDEFTLLDRGTVLVHATADDARGRYRRIRARFPRPAAEIDVPGSLQVRREGRELEVVVNGEGDRVLERLREQGPEALGSESLSLEEIFLAVAGPGGERR